MKKNRILRSVSITLASVAVVSFCLIGAPDVKADVSNDSTVQSYEDQMRYLEARQRELQNQLTKTASDIYDQQVYQQQLETLIETVQSKIKIAEDLVGTLEENRSALEEEIAETERNMNKTFNEFLTYMRMSYEDGNATYLGLILGADSLSDFLSRIDRVSSMLAYNKKLMDEYKVQKKTLQDKKEECQLAIELQESAIKDLEKTRTENTALLTNATVYLGQLKNAQSSYNEQIAANQKAWEEANAALTAYLEELARKSQSQYDQQGFAWPMDTNYFNYMTSAYGWRWIFGTNDFHLGIDIWGYSCYGADIHASASGTVVIAQPTDSSSYGKYVVIDHGSGITTLYAHCSEVLVQVGQYVSKGQVISKCGATGRVTGAHLHFEYRINGQTQNPLDFVNVPSNFVDISG